MSLDVAILNYAAFRNVFQPLCNPCLFPFKILNSLPYQAKKFDHFRTYSNMCCTFCTNRDVNAQITNCMQAGTH